MKKGYNVQIQTIIKTELVQSYFGSSNNINLNSMDTTYKFIFISVANTGETMVNKEEDEIKNKQETKKMKKAPKTFTIKQIIRTVVITLALLSLGAFAGIQIQSAINSHIESKVTEQVKVFTEAVK